MRFKLPLLYRGIKPLGFQGIRRNRRLIAAWADLRLLRIKQVDWKRRTEIRGRPQLGAIGFRDYRI